MNPEIALLTQAFIKNKEKLSLQGILSPIEVEVLPTCEWELSPCGKITIIQRERENKRERWCKEMVCGRSSVIREAVHREMPAPTRTVKETNRTTHTPQLEGHRWFRHGIYSSGCVNGLGNPPKLDLCCQRPSDFSPRHRTMRMHQKNDLQYWRGHGDRGTLIYYC